ncbi:MAG: N-acetylglucosamine-6-phosphate deacetylase [Actinomycetes bacterium]
MTEVLAAAGVLREGAIGPGWIAIDHGRVTGTGWGSAPRGARDLGDVILAPGFVDIQVNGCGTVDFLRARGDEWSVSGRALADAGTTSYLATLCSSPRERYADALGRVDAARRRAEGARIDGVHLEGPFLGGAPGAHPQALLGPADPVWMDALLAAHPGLVRLVTLAPEADPGGAATRALVAAGVRVALGHSTCSVEAARAAADAGATIVTHLGNGMRPMHQRDPGLVGAALTDPRLVPSVIADGIHVDDVFLQVATTMRPDAILVSDAVATGVDHLGGAVTGRDGAAFLPDGTLTGATVALDACVRTAVRIGVPIDRALAMASVHPARAVGIDTWGAVGIGGRADLVALAPSSTRVLGTWIDGVPHEADLR